ncbi:MAG: hypothetical protein JSV78_10895 [Phycisphaerales bacterium]|nr:MAG: hypothetical protein JSV78_10895 [Phycisphaerales bacterium]
MEQKTVAGIVVVVAFAVCGGLLFVLPSLQSADRTADEVASEHIERARRYLHNYSASIAHTAPLLDQMRGLADEGVDVDAEDIEGLLESAESLYQEEYEANWEQFAAVVEGRPDFGDIEGQISQAVNARDGLIEKNEELLAAALREVDQAIRESSSCAEAHRLKGVILYHQGLGHLTNARMIAVEAEPLRYELFTLASRVNEDTQSETLVEDSGIEEVINILGAEAGTTEKAIEADRAALAQLDQTIQERERELEEARSRLENARVAMDQLKAEGIDFADPKGADQFAERYSEADRSYREALSAVYALEHGTYPNASLDRSGDALTGRYVENGSPDDLTISYGLTHYVNDRAVLAARLESEELALDALLSDVARLENAKERYAAKKDLALEGIQEAKARAVEVLEELDAVMEDAEAEGDAAIEGFTQSARASKSAAQYAGNWIRDAADRARDLSASAREYSAYESRSKDNWLVAASLAQVADAHLCIAWAQHAVYEGRMLNHRVLTDVAETLALSEADPSGEKEIADEAKDAGIEAIQTAMNELADAHQKGGRHWTFTAQAAGTTYLMVLFGHEQYAQDVVAGYRQALEGREEEPYTAKLAARLSQLQGRR